MKKWISGLLLLVLMMGICACSGVKASIAQLKDELNQDVIAQPSTIDLAENEQENTLEVPSIDDISIEETYQPVPTASENQVPMVAVELYFASEDGKNLVMEKKEIPKVEGVARATIEALLEGPSEQSGLRSAIPAGTDLLDINIKADEKLCIVDFSKEIAAIDSGISEDVTVYAIANTLCQFDTVDAVEFRVEGMSVTTLDGGSDLSRAVSANAALVK